jgi:hypothetical protein
MGLGDFGGLRGLDNIFVEFLRVGGGKRLKAKAIDLGRSGCAFTLAFGRAETPSARLLIRRAEALRFRSECIGLWLKGE